ncbi:hypothetical protein DPMN_136040 [Dreissena polymorpha]|uniref:Uncharacterized protein n=1 Tax=Dreissena polymorpha TaxID=45954 RepID=A0A9D4JGB8_DREPO|nr:hypothetical protein DPMN_136040 [Dreissena polymorpha]
MLCKTQEQTWNDLPCSDKKACSEQNEIISMPVDLAVVKEEMRGNVSPRTRGTEAPMPVAKCYLKKTHVKFTSSISVKTKNTKICSLKRLEHAFPTFTSHRTLSHFVCRRNC